MTPLQTPAARHRSFIMALIGALVIYVAFVFAPGVSSTVVVGFQGKFDNGRFKVTRVLTDTPAKLAGIRAGDIIDRAAGISMGDWRSIYDDKLASYLEGRQRWRSEPVMIEVLRDSSSLSQVSLNIVVTPHLLTAGDYVRIFGIRTLFGVLLLVLVVSILVSGTRELSAFLVAILFLLNLFWLFGGIRFWPGFMSPLIHDVDAGVFLAGQLGTILALQLVPSTMIMFALEFPERHFAFRRWLWLPVYTIPIVLFMLAMLISNGTWVERAKDAYTTRVLVNSVSLVVVVLLLITGYRNCKSPSHRERTRWVVGAMIISVGSVLFLWNIPTLVSGYPLIPDFDWLAAPISLVPITMTMGMVNHRLFGVHGMIRRRIGFLERMVTREKSMVTSRDQRILDLVGEIKQLKSELLQYSIQEKTGSTYAYDDEPRMKQLLTRFPELDEIRRERLLGASPVWVRVFEQIALASRGDIPVLIVGESGTGKTDTAFAIHRLSDRNGLIYRELSCSQFQHADPAFALGKLFGIGAGHGLQNVPREGHKGLLEDCDGGTLLLDDFDCLPRNVQDLLLYPLEGKAFEPGVGQGPARTVSVKFILATNQDPDRLVERGLLRPDVLARFGVRVDVPPLRERREDIPVLAEHFLAECAAEVGHEMSMISPRALNMLSGFDFAAGNARELKSELRQAVGKAMLEGDTILRAGYLSDLSGAYPAIINPSTDPREPLKPDDTTMVPELPDEVGSTARDRNQPLELGVLRKHRFRIKQSEIELGLSHKSRTLSNYLRGICIRALAENQWDEQAAARAVADNDDPQVVAKLRGKIRRYVENIRSGAASGDSRRLYNNLPVTYRTDLKAALEYFRGR